MSDTITTPQELQAWMDKRIASNERLAPPAPAMDWDAVLAQLATLPPETPEEQAERERRLEASQRADRLAQFRRICPPEFACKVDKGQLSNPVAFDAVAGWNGHFRGFLASGPTGSGKTRAAWSALGRLIVEEKRTMSWFPVKKLITDTERYEKKDLAEEFWKLYRNWDLLFVDDLDKFNVQFESQGATVFQFYDWCYREHRPIITTTNKDRNWWTKLMGEAFARRLFDDVHDHIQF